MFKRLKTSFATLCFLTFWFGASAQWDIIHEGGNNGGHRDLFFLNNDSGFVIGSNPEGSFILRTRDGGAAWDSLWFDNHFFRSLYFPSIDTGYVSCFFQSTISVMRTIDGGDSWLRIADSLEFANEIPYAISFFDNNNGIINLQGWAAKTTDAGETWDVFDNFPAGGGTRDGDAKENIFVGLDGTILISSFDLGMTFDHDTISYQGSHIFSWLKDHRFISSAIGGYGFQLGFNQFSFGIVTIGNLSTDAYNVSYFPNLVRVLGVCWSTEDIMYAICIPAAFEGEEIKFLMKSIDGGQHWYYQQINDPYYFGTESIFCPTDSVCYAVGGNNAYIYKTSNGGGPLLDQVNQIPLSVKEISDDIDFSIAPNPSAGVFIIRSEREALSQLSIYDLQGKEILSIFPKDFTATINLEPFGTGLYIVQVLAGDKIRTAKVVVE